MKIYKFSLLVLLSLSVTISFSQVLTQGTISKTGSSKVTIYTKPDVSITTTFLNNQFSISIPTPAGGNPTPTVAVVTNHVPNLDWEVKPPFVEGGRTFWDVLGTDNGGSTTVTWTSGVDNAQLELEFSGGSTSEIIQLNDLASGGAIFQSYWYLSVINGVCGCDGDGDITDYTAKFYGPGASNGADSYVPTQVSVDLDVTLPLLVADFSAQAYNNTSSYLYWTTIDEVSFSRFELDRSANGLTWENIATVNAGKARSGGPNDYYYIDQEVYDGFGDQTYYYRLLMMDHDGSYTYSKIREVTFRSDGFNEKLVIFPNPTDSDVYYMLDGVTPGAALNLTIYDLQGRLVMDKNVTYQQGKNYILDMQNREWQNGMYNLVIKDDNGLFLQERFVYRNN